MCEIKLIPKNSRPPHPSSSIIQETLINNPKSSYAEFRNKRLHEQKVVTYLQDPTIQSVAYNPQ